VKSAPVSSRSAAGLPFTWPSSKTMLLTPWNETEILRVKSWSEENQRRDSENTDTTRTLCVFMRERLDVSALKDMVGTVRFERTTFRV
jgi:hypothetical protein